MDTKVSEPTKLYPTSFLLGLAGTLKNDLNQLFACYQIPVEAMRALDVADFLEVLSNENPETFKPGGVEGWLREVSDAIQDMANLREVVNELRRSKVRSLTDEENRNASKLLHQYTSSNGL